MRNNPQSAKEDTIKMAFACDSIPVTFLNCQIDPFPILPTYKK